MFGRIREDIRCVFDRDPAAELPLDELALVAAYANRNLIVEQRVAQIYQALGYTTEANHQAMHRMISLLNSGNIDASCRPDAAGPGTLRLSAGLEHPGDLVDDVARALKAASR